MGYEACRTLCSFIAISGPTINEASLFSRNKKTDISLVVRGLANLAHVPYGTDVMTPKGPQQAADIAVLKSRHAAVPAT